jgi:hypothetical protein
MVTATLDRFVRPLIRVRLTLVAFGSPHAVDAFVKSEGSSDEFGSNDCPLQLNKDICDSILITPGEVPAGSASKMVKFILRVLPGSEKYIELLAGVSAVEK